MLLREIEKVKREKQEAIEEQMKWRTRLGTLSFKCEAIIGHSINHPHSSHRVPLAAILCESATNEAAEYLSNSKHPN